MQCVSASMTEELPHLLTVAEVAARWKVRPPRVYQLIRDRVLPGVVRVGRQIRLDASCLREWAAAGGQPLPGAVSDLSRNAPRVACGVVPGTGKPPTTA